MYIRDCGYGRTKKCRRKVWPLIGLCVLALGLSGITIRVMAGQWHGSAGYGGWITGQETAFTEQEITFTGQKTAFTGQETGLTGPNAGLPGQESEWIEIVKEEEPEENKDPLIVIDPGHGGEDEGCSRAGILEKTINLQMGLALRDKLTQMGYDVIMTRDDDTSVSLEERVNAAGEARADIYISIHQNACEEDPGVKGVETWYNGTGEGENSRRLAELIHKDVLLYTDAQDRTLWEDETLYVIRETDMPSCLIETGFLSNAGERGKLCDPEYQDKIVEGIASGVDLYFHPKTMYLTFDDGPSPENTGKVLDILKARNIKATFFLVGENVRKNPEVAKRIAAEGHTIGIHCNSHDYRKLYESVDSYLADFEEAYQTVYEVTGVKAQLFRFPGGSINSYNKKVYQDIIDEMTDRGYIYFDWNASMEDAVRRPDPDTLISNAVETTFGRKKVVMLAHDVVNETALCLDQALELLPEYEMEPLTAEVEPIHF